MKGLVFQMRLSIHESGKDEFVQRVMNSDFRQQYVRPSLLVQKEDESFYRYK